MSNKRSMLDRSIRWDSGYIKPKGKFAKRQHNKRIRRYKEVICDGGFFKKVAPKIWEWC